MADVIERARSWIQADPDPETREELEALIESGDVQELSQRMDGSLEFGTAGIRGAVEAGSARMNRAVVIRTTRGLADHLIDVNHGVPDAPVVVGFDARPSSRQFAEDAAGVLAAAGIRVLYFPEVTPTPLVAFACRHLGAAAAVVVTASHNPPADNGYKVYASNGAQIIPPTDTAIAAAIDRTGPANDVPRLESAFSGGENVSAVPSDLVDRYWQEVDGNRPNPTSSSLKIVYTPIHGVGGATLAQLFERAGHGGLIPVPEQADPDGKFPTVNFPNPEEPGSMDLAIQLADAVDADLVIANDPDADRFAAVIPVDGEWRRLTGNEIGVLLGDYVLRHHRRAKRPIVINSIVSSPMLGKLAAFRGAHFERTLTGFKWIANAGMALEDSGVGEFVFGYEEALGYTIGGTVRDKDGISAAVVFADLAAGLAEAGETMLDRLGELWSIAGVWASSQHSIVRHGPSGEEKMREAIDLIAQNPPDEVDGMRVTDIADYRTGAERRPMWLGNQALVELTLGTDGRILVRPSGTEPKLKVYTDLTSPAEADSQTQQLHLQESADRLARSFEANLVI